MARSYGKIENQHYVPQFLLKNFSVNQRKEYFIHTYDKHVGKSFFPNIRNIASERGFYDFYIGDEDRSLEPILSELESKTERAIDKIIQKQRLDALNDEDKGQVALYVAIQFLRVKKQREIVKQFQSLMQDHLDKISGASGSKKFSVEMNEEEIKVQSMQAFAKSTPILTELILNKDWILLKFPKRNRLYISDHPVVMHNDKSFGPYGNIGFAVPAIQIYFPISSDLALGFLCPSIGRQIQENISEFESSSSKLRSVLLLKPYLPNRQEIELTLQMYESMQKALTEHYNVMNSGDAVIATSDNAKFMNSLQVHWSHRFVMCQEKDFSLVEKMIEDNPDYKKGIGIKIN